MQHTHLKNYYNNLKGNLHRIGFGINKGNFCMKCIQMVTTHMKHKQLNNRHIFSIYHLNRNLQDNLLYMCLNVGKKCKKCSHFQFLCHMLDMFYDMQHIPSQCRLDNYLLDNLILEHMQNNLYLNNKEKYIMYNYLLSLNLNTCNMQDDIQYIFYLLQMKSIQAHILIRICLFLNIGEDCRNHTCLFSYLSNRFCRKSDIIHNEEDFLLVKGNIFLDNPIGSCSLIIDNLNHIISNLNYHI